MPPKKTAAKSKNQENPLGDAKTIIKSVSQSVPSTRSLRPRNPQPAASPKQVPKKQPSKRKLNTVKGERQQSPKAKLKKSSEESPAENPSDEEVTETEANNVNIQNGHSSATSIHEFKAKTIEGEEICLDSYKGHACIIVNVASKCGHTAVHYKELVQLYKQYADEKGLRILAFPCNQFGKQEPGDSEKICEFAKKRNVEFDMFEKVEVNGKNAHPLWKYLTSQISGPKGSKIDWNFTKFLVDKEGKVVGRFKPGIKPSALIPELEKLW